MNSQTHPPPAKVITEILVRNLYFGLRITQPHESCIGIDHFIQTYKTVWASKSVRNPDDSRTGRRRRV